MEVPPWQLKQLAVKMGSTSRSKVMAWAKQAWRRGGSRQVQEQQEETWLVHQSRIAATVSALAAVPSPGLHDRRRVATLSPQTGEELFFVWPKLMSLAMT
jgi:hypothetical protein